MACGVGRRPCTVKPVLARTPTKNKRADYPWQVRIEDDGAVRGAGIMLDGEYVLTCAHVVVRSSEVPAEPALRVRFDSRENVSHRSADIVAECFCPADDETGRGDVALLRLRTPIPDQPRTLLRRNWRVGQRIRVFGYPDGVPHGMWADARIAGPAMSQSQLVQLNVPVDSPRIECGFSGAAVIDAETGELIGMIRSCEQGPRGACWMIPVDAIVKNAPLAARYVSGPSTDCRSSELTDKPLLAAAEGELLRELARWLGSDGPGGICVIAGGGESVREALFSRLTERGEAGVAAAYGARAIDVAVHAAGKTTGQVSRQLVTGLGGGTDGRVNIARLVTDLGSAAGVVVDEMDAADEPEALLDELTHLVTSFPRPPLRLLLGFRTQVPGRVRNALIAEFPAERRRSDTAAPADLLADANARLAKAETGLDELIAAEDKASRKHAHVVIRITDVPPPDVAAGTALRVRLAVLRATRGAAGTEWLAEIKACEHALQNRRAQVTEAMERLDELLACRAELRARLAIFGQLAARLGLEEDDQTSGYYRTAHEMVWRAPCDLGGAEQAVDSYYGVIMRRQERR
jgi:Trypsin-like peptidase domain